MRQIYRVSSGLALVATLLLATACAQLAARAVPNDTQSELPPLVWPKAPAEERIRYLRSVRGPQDWGISRSWWTRMVDALSGRELAALLRPTAVAERAGVLYVADPGVPAVWLLDAPRDRYVKVTQAGDLGLLSPVGLALGPAGSIFVADSGLKKVVQLDQDGKLLRVITAPGLERPVGLVWDESAQRLFVLDSVRHQIAVVDGNGTLLRYLGASGDQDGQFNRPTHLALDGSDSSGTLLVNDALNFRVQALSPDGEFLWKFGQVGNGAGDFAAPKGVANDSAGHIYVVDALFDVVQIFDRQGQLLLGFGEHGSKAGQFALPRGIYISSEDKVYVADTYNQRVQIFRGAVAASATVKEGSK